MKKTISFLVFTSNFEKWVDSYRTALSIYNRLKRKYSSVRLYEFIYQGEEPVDARCLKACGELPN